jgi:flagella basal body P-ring formation protein FlgA
MKRTTRLLFTSWLILSGSAGSPTPCVADSSVTLNPDVEIMRPAVRLSDLFTGVPSGIDRDIAQAPAACKPALYGEDVLKKLAQTYRLDWKEQSSSDHISLSSPCTRITGDMIHDAVVAKLKADGNAKRLSFDVAFDRHNLELNLPTDDNPGFALENFSFDPVAKVFRADLTAQTPRGPYVLPVTGRVSVRRNIPILAHRLEGGTVIGTNDLDWIEVPEDRVTADVVTESSQLIGREIRHDLPEGEILRSHDIMPPQLVKRGTLVTMKIETPYILITAQGKALQDGAEGDTVRVTNTQSNRIVEGIVIAPGVVEIHVARKIASAE